MPCEDHLCWDWGRLLVTNHRQNFSFVKMSLVPACLVVVTRGQCSQCLVVNRSYPGRQGGGGVSSQRHTGRDENQAEEKQLFRISSHNVTWKGSIWGQWGCLSKTGHEEDLFFINLQHMKNLQKITDDATPVIVCPGTESEFSWLAETLLKVLKEKLPSPERRVLRAHSRDVSSDLEWERITRNKSNETV